MNLLLVSASQHCIQEDTTCRPVFNGDYGGHDIAAWWWVDAKVWRGNATFVKTDHVLMWQQPLWQENTNNNCEISRQTQSERGNILAWKHKKHSFIKECGCVRNATLWYVTPAEIHDNFFKVFHCWMQALFSLYLCCRNTLHDYACVDLTLASRYTTWQFPLHAYLPTSNSRTLHHSSTIQNPLVPRSSLCSFTISIVEMGIYIK